MIEIAYHEMNRDSNFTRCYRTIYSFLGSTTIHLINSKCQLKERYLYSSKGAHEIKKYETDKKLFKEYGEYIHIIIEMNGKEPVQNIKNHLDVTKPYKIIIHFGGESVQLPKTKKPYRHLLNFKIETKNQLCLTSDMATGIVLYEVCKAL